MKTLNALLPALLISFASCQTGEIISEQDSTIDFSAYHTFSVCLDDFQVISYNQPEANNEKMKSYVKEAMDAEMEKYYTLNDTLPELRAGAKIKLEGRKFTYKSCDRRDDYHAWPECRLITQEYAVGTILIYVADVAKNQIIWQATVSGITGEDLADNKKVVDRTVQSLFEKFPLYKKVEATP